MTIDKYLTEDGVYVKDGVTSLTAQDFLQVEILNFCGCGDPDLSLRHVQIGLDRISKLEAKRESGQSYEESKIFHAETHNLLGNEQSAYFLWYYLDNEGFTEHGGSVPGWLTKKGKNFLQDLNEYFEKLKKK